MSLLTARQLSELGLEDREKGQRQSGVDFHESGVLLIDKTSGISSMDVIRLVKRIIRPKKMGHGGTLDPLATGLLPILINDATKASDRIMAGTKEYEGSFLLGYVFDTQDISGSKLSECSLPIDLTIEKIQEAAQTLVGEIDQFPPMYSAVKKAGRPLYDYARAGESVELKPRRVVVEKFEVLDWDGDRRCRFAARVQKGVYVRTLIHDLGQRLGIGAVTETLRRTQVGRYGIEEAIQIPTLKFVGDISSRLRPYR
jgi:tRNA pseudouridine55 synthase